MLLAVRMRRFVGSFVMNHENQFDFLQNFAPNQHFADVCKIIDVIDPKLRYISTSIPTLFLIPLLSSVWMSSVGF